MATSGASANVMVTLQPPRTFKSLDNPVEVYLFWRRIKRYRGDSGAMSIAQMVQDGLQETMFGDLLEVAEKRFEVSLS